MNILLVCHYGLYRDLGSSFVHAQAKAYAELGHRVKVLVPIAVGKKDWQGKRWGESAFTADGVEILSMRHLSLSRYGKRWFNPKTAMLALKSFSGHRLRDFQPDVIHAHTLGTDSKLGAWLSKQLDCPLVVTTHGSDTSIPYERGEKRQLKNCCDQANAVVGVSSKLVEKLIDCGVKNGSVILNGFALQHMSADMDKQPVTILQAGHLLKQKRNHLTIQAFAEIKERYPKAKLTIIGQGPEQNSLERLCKELHVTDSVQFTGQISHTEVLAKMAKTQFFVMPSVREGFGIVYLEAMANGCITIGTEGEGIADLIVSGKNGFLVPPDDPAAIVKTIEWCLERPEQAAAIAERGRQDALGLTWEKNARQYIALFEELQKEKV